MTDYFILLNQPRRPWLDADSLKQTFLTLSAGAHPDKIHSASDADKADATKKFTELNAAFTCLADPKSRLLHLLELERGAKPADIQQIPAALADLFAGIATTCRHADAFLAEKAQVTSPLLQVQLFERGQDWVEQLNALQQTMTDLRERAMTDLKSLDAEWMKTHHVRVQENRESVHSAGSFSPLGGEGWDEGARQRETLLFKLEELYRLFGYFNRWQNQIRERVVQLSF